MRHRGEDLAKRKTEELLLAWLGREETLVEVEEWLASGGGEELSLTDLVQRFSPRASSPPEKKRWKFSPIFDDPLPSLRRRSGSLAAVDEDDSIRERWRQLARTEDEILPMLTFSPLAAELCQLPTICGPLVFARCADSPKGVSCQAFLEYWKTNLKKLKKPQDRLFVLVAAPGAAAITTSDWDPLINFVVTTHPGLSFLEEHEEFQEKYARTVATRIFYRVNLSRTGYITRRELAKASPCVVDALFRLEQTDDVNAEISYFSYEHFYVLYCQFWELDHDKDGKLGRTDLLKYGGHRLSRAIVDRVFEAAPRYKRKSSPSELSYADFVYFMLAEEDKTTEAALRYWFACVDVDGDGVVDLRDARHFYDVQAQRMECLGHEVVPLQDVLCQMADLLDARAPALRLTIDDFLHPSKLRLVGVFFDALFSLDKFVAFEQRDPFADRLKRDDPFDSDWDRFAAAEYARLATEDDDDDDDVVVGANDHSKLD